VLFGPVVWAPTASAAFPGDNGQIVFVKSVANSAPLYSVKPDGSGLRKITRGRYDAVPSVAPNGRTIAFARNAAILTVHINGRHRKRLTPLDTSYEPAFSGPLGRRITFTRTNSITSRIWVMAADGTHERTLTNPRTADRFPTFSPDGKWIAFDRPDHRHNDRIYKMRSDGSDVRRLTQAKQGGGPLSFAPTGKSIVFERILRNGKGVVCLMRANGSHVRRVRRGEDPAFSPNGKRIVFARGDVIYTMDRRGGHLRRVTPRAWTASNPDWAVRPE
jgi:TolB protein